MTNFAALRFAEDENISGRIYWYLCEVPVKPGDRVLAPVGFRNRLQAAIVERTLFAERENAPYNPGFIKSVAAECGARKLLADGCECLELGGVRYAKKHFTPFGRILLTRTMPKRLEELRAYGVTEILDCAEDGAVYDKIARAKGCVLLVGTDGERVFQKLLDLARGINKPLYDLGVKTQTVELLREKLQ